MNNRGLSILALLFACGGSEEQMLTESPANVCDLRFAEAEPWCGGNPTGTWSYQGACHEPALRILHELCPAGSFKMIPARITGRLTLTSTSVKGNFAFHEDSPAVIELYEGCIDALGTCPRSLEGAPLQCEGDGETMCSCDIAPFVVIGSDQGETSIKENKVAYNAFDPAVESEFCVEPEFMFFDGLGREGYSDFDFFYVLSRTP